MCNYYTGTTTVLLVPVKVVYHDASSIVYNYDYPTRPEVEKALIESISIEELATIKEMVNEAYKVMKPFQQSIDGPMQIVSTCLYRIGHILKMWKDK